MSALDRVIRIFGGQAPTEDQLRELISFRESYRRCHSGAHDMIHLIAAFMLAYSEATWGWWVAWGVVFGLAVLVEANKK